MAIVAEDSITLNGNSVGANAYANTINITTSGTTVLTVPSGVGSMFITINFTGSGYTHNITLPVNDSNGTVIPAGFGIQILASIPAGSNITVNYIDGVTATTNLTLVADATINPLPVNWFIKQTPPSGWDWKIGGAMPYQKVVWANTDSEVRDYLGITAITNAIQAEIDVWTELKQATNITNNSNTTPVNIAGLTTNVIAGCTHKIEYTIMFSSAAAGTGIGLTLRTLYGAAGSFSLATRIPIAGDGTAAEFQGTINSFNDYVTGTAVPVANGLFIAQIVGIFNCTTSGTIVPAFRSEINGTVVTVYSGSTVLDRVFP